MPALRVIVNRDVLLSVAWLKPDTRANRMPAVIGGIMNRWPVTRLEQMQVSSATAHQVSVHPAGRHRL